MSSDGLRLDCLELETKSSLKYFASLLSLSKATQSGTWICFVLYFTVLTKKVAPFIFNCNKFTELFSVRQVKFSWYGSCATSECPLWKSVVQVELCSMWLEYRVPPAFFFWQNVRSYLLLCSHLSLPCYLRWKREITMRADVWTYAIKV